MSLINTIQIEQADGAARELYQKQQLQYGYVPNYAKIFCYRPDTAQRPT